VSLVHEPLCLRASESSDVPDEVVCEATTQSVLPSVSPLADHAPAEAVAESRTTCYPQDAEAPPLVLGQPRTTVYRQAVRWNRGGYDTLN